MKLWIRNQIMRRAADADRLARIKAAARMNRERSGAPRRLRYFHRFGDPVSALMAPLLVTLADRYGLTIEPWLVGPPEQAVAPEAAQLAAFSRVDSERLAEAIGQSIAGFSAEPDPESIRRAEALASAKLVRPTALQDVADLDQALWSSAPLPAGSEGDRAAALKAGTALRDRLGHFQSGAVLYEGEWYWGADRLHYLEARLDAEGARRSGEGFLAPPLLETQQTGDARGAVIEVYPSLRSPYTWLAIERIYALARRWNARVDLRPVLPMVMRSLPVPRRKGLYFLMDCRREADRLGLKFGHISDPVGKPTERGLAVLMAALDEGRGEAFVTAFLRGAWSEGVNAGTDQGLKRICAAAGVDWGRAGRALADDSWRVRVEAHRERLTSNGLWGVPSFKVGQLSVWGQDRLWAVEAELRRLAEERE